MPTNELAPHVQEIARALANRVEMEQIEDELTRYLEYGVPLAQAKRDIVRNHGGTLRAGAKKVKDLQPGETSVDLLVKVLTRNAKEIQVKGQPKTIWFGFLADETGKTPYTMWKDHPIEPGRSFAIGNVYVKAGFREGVEVNVGDFARVSPSDAEVELPDAIAGPARSSLPGGELAIMQLADGMNSVTVTARVLDAREKTIAGASGPRTLFEGELADDSGRIVFTAWAPEKHAALLAKDAVVKIENAYVKAFRGTPNLNFGENATVTPLAATTLPPSTALALPKLVAIGDVERAGGGTGVLVEGVVLEVKKGSGLIQRCPQCNRVLQKRECRLHGKVDGTYDLRVKGVLDDGTGAVTFFLGRAVTEKILGKTLEQCQAIAKEAMTMDVIQDDLVEALTARRLAITGNATSDEFGLQLIGHESAPPAPIDVKAEAEKLLAKVHEHLAEVA